MQPFLQEVAATLYRQYGNKISQLHIVLPSRRSCTYFKHYLAELAEGNMLLPEVLSYNDFVQQLGETQVLDRVSLLFELYRCYRGDDARTDALEMFLPLGSTILADFNTIDRNLDFQQALKLFDYLEDVKALERWAEQLGKEAEDLPLYDGSSMKDFLAFWKSLKATYIRFREGLQRQQKAYSGLAYRLVLEDLDKLVEKNDIRQVVFAGFFQLTSVEEQIMQRLCKSGKAVTFWDADEYYVNDQNQEAGFYLRKYLGKWLKGQQFYKGLVNRPGRRFRMISTNSQVTQAKVAGKILKEQLLQVLKQGKLQEFKQSVNHTAILLPDDQMLLPVFYSLPSLAEEAAEAGEEGFNLMDHVNVTMGLSLKISPLFGLIDAIFAMQKNLRKPDDELLFYHKDLLKVLKHPFLQKIGIEEEKRDALLLDVYKSNKVLISRSWLLEKSENSEAFNLIFSSWKGSATSAITWFFSFAEMLTGLLSQEKYRLEQEFLLEFYKTLKRLEDVLGREQEDVSINTFKRFLYEMLRSGSVPFTGEPVSPIQIMGMLESRTLDFDNVIILSCNEGMMPQGKRNDSLVPYDVLREFHLPTHLENDSSAAYTFYRLLHRCTTFTTIYTDPAFSGDGREKSRLLTQLLEEIPFGPGEVAHEHVREKEEEGDMPTVPAPNQLLLQQVEMKLPLGRLQPNQVVKDEQVLQRVAESLKSGLSPSALNRYIGNALQFFYEKVLKVGEVEPIREYMQAKEFGTVVHNVLEDLLKPMTGQEVTASELLRLSGQKDLIADTLLQKLQSELPGTETDTGKNYILRQVGEDLLQRFLEISAKEAPFTLLMMEKFLNHTLHLSLKDGRRVSLHLGGKADRIDYLADGSVRVLDYKTGSSSAADLKIKSLGDLLTDPSKGKVLQLILYKYLAIKNLQTGEIKNLPKGAKPQKVVSGFYFFRQWDKAFVAYNWPEEPESPRDFCGEVEKMLLVLVESIMDADAPFTDQAPDFSPWLAQLAPPAAEAAE